MFAESAYTFNEEDGSGSIEIVKSDSLDESFMVRVYGGTLVRLGVSIPGGGLGPTIIIHNTLTVSISEVQSTHSE